TTAQPAEKDASRAEQSAGSASLVSESEGLAPLTQLQKLTQRRTELLKFKATAEHAQLEKAPPPSAQDKAKKIPSEQPDPEALKAGYKKAIELAPRAVEQMEHAVKALERSDRQTAFPRAEEARKILDEIQKAQPQKPPDQKDQEQQKDDQPKQQPKDQQNSDQ